MLVCDVQHRPHLLELLKQSKGVRKKQLSEEIEKTTGAPPNTKLLTILLRVRKRGRGCPALATNSFHSPSVS